jgi:hypothetical protein
VKVIACIEDPVVIRKILAYLEGKVVPQPPGLSPVSGSTIWLFGRIDVDNRIDVFSARGGGRTLIR